MVDRQIHNRLQDGDGQNDLRVVSPSMHRVLRAWDKVPILSLIGIS
jgi:hypothetical protein